MNILSFFTFPLLGTFIDYSSPHPSSVLLSQTHFVCPSSCSWYSQRFAHLGDSNVFFESRIFMRSRRRPWTKVAGNPSPEKQQSTSRPVLPCFAQYLVISLFIEQPSGMQSHDSLMVPAPRIISDSLTYLIASLQHHCESWCPLESSLERKARAIAPGLRRWPRL